MSTTQIRAIFDLARVNGEGLPGYFRLDLRADYRFTVRKMPVLLFVVAQNITGRIGIGGTSRLLRRVGPRNCTASLSQDRT